MWGFHGRYLRVDLGTGRSERRALPEPVLRRHLGGVGLGSWLLHREAPPGVDPLAPEAPVVFSFSPLVGTPLTTSAKFAVVAKSPLTGLISDGLSSSHFAIAGKGEGVDAIVLTGRCAEPSDLVRGELRPSASWGRSAAEAEQALAEEGRVAAIGPAGERGVRFASLSNGGRHVGRGGLGAVLGAKRLKSIVVGGSTPTPLADRERVLALARELARRSQGPATAKYRELGTAANVASLDRLAALPTRNFQRNRFDAAQGLSAETLGPKHEQARESCASCTIGCEHRYRFGAGETTRVEYQSLFALGSLCGIADADAVLGAAARCDELGLDTISAGATVAFAMECGERGWLEGAPRFGDAEGLLALLDDIAERRGLGALLALGSRQAAEQLGGGAPAIAAHVKGLEIPGYEPRALQTMALGLAVGTRGADHNRSGAYEADLSEARRGPADDARRTRLAIESEDRAALLDSLVLCKFLRGVFEDLYAESAALLQAVTGWAVSADELRAVARRIVALRKAFNIREGWRPEDDTLPDRFLEEALCDGASAGSRLTRARLHEMIRAYNLARGWTESGYLPDAVLRALWIDGGRLRDVPSDPEAGEPRP